MVAKTHGFAIMGCSAIVSVPNASSWGGAEFEKFEKFESWGVGEGKSLNSLKSLKCLRIGEFARGRA